MYPAKLSLLLQSRCLVLLGAFLLQCNYQKRKGGNTAARV